MDCSKEARLCLDEGYNCAQSVFSAYCTQYGIDKALAIRLTSGMGGGLAGLGRLCGAVSGACLLLGLKYGPATLEDVAAKENVQELVREFIARFEAIHGTTTCCELLGAAPLKESPEELAQRKRVCNNVVQDAARIVGELL